MSIKEVIQIAEIKLNFTYNRLFESSLYTITKKIQAETNEILRESKIKKIKDIELKKKIFENNIKNRGRKKLTFKLGDKVIIRNNSQDKIDDLYIGPYVITEIN
ncbi:hypothetical protein DMUE_3845 [Dictyocoela muelleri]|nr:hypothetical protein DMUE_3845 [Dictyocoela muelleri]